MAFHVVYEKVLHCRINLIVRKSRLLFLASLRQLRAPSVNGGVGWESSVCVPEASLVIDLPAMLS